MGPGTSLQRTVGLAKVGFAQSDRGRTELTDLHQAGAAKVRLPKVHTGAHAEAVLINTSGGLTDGDRLDTIVSIGPGADAVVTTQACERIYRAASPSPAIIDTSITVGAGATFAWLPQETILFDGGYVDRTNKVDLSGDAAFIGVESVILGRLSMGETVSTGSFRDRWQIRRDGKLIFADGFALSGDIAAQIERPALLACNRYISTILYAAADAETHLDAVRTAVEGSGAASAFDDKLIVRLICGDGRQLRQALEAALAVLRSNRPLPRVWHI
ncbi:MAG: urease accessory protein UreD [Pseudomonadota bacterium]